MSIQHFASSELVIDCFGEIGMIGEGVIVLIGLVRFSRVDWSLVGLVQM